MKACVTLILPSRSTAQTARFKETLRAVYSQTDLKFIINESATHPTIQEWSSNDADSERRAGNQEEPVEALCQSIQKLAGRLFKGPEV